MITLGFLLRLLHAKNSGYAMVALVMITARTWCLLLSQDLFIAFLLWTLFVAGFKPIGVFQITQTCIQVTKSVIPVILFPSALGRLQSCGFTQTRGVRSWNSTSSPASQLGNCRRGQRTLRTRCWWRIPRPWPWSRTALICSPHLWPGNCWGPRRRAGPGTW